MREITHSKKTILNPVYFSQTIPVRSVVALDDAVNYSIQARSTSTSRDNGSVDRPLAETEIISRSCNQKCRNNRLLLINPSLLNPSLKQSSVFGHTSPVIGRFKFPHFLRITIVSNVGLSD